MAVETTLLEKYLGTVVTLVVTALTAVVGWAARLGGRLTKAEERLAVAEAEARHARADQAELKTLVNSRHDEQARQIEKLGERFDKRFDELRSWR